MSKKKRFGISEALTRGLTETIHVVENNSGVFRNIILPLSRIELDPDNPRKLAITLDDVKTGLKSDDPDYQVKQEELVKLKELAHTISSSGVINPIVVYKRGELYRVVAGERRSLASIIAGKQEIEARVFTEKPKGFELKLIQWIENTAREDLTLSERLGNVHEIILAYQHQNNITTMTATTLKQITGLSLSQSTYYLAAINAQDDVQEAIQNGGIRNLDKAALLASVDDNDIRRQGVTACTEGASLKELRAIINQQKQLTSKAKAPIKVKSRGRAATQVNMGSTKQTEVIRTLVDSVVSQDAYKKYADTFETINWNDLKQTTKAFRKLVELLEMEMAV